MLQVALWEPEIPPNTGNIARLCAATRCPLHLIGRLGFRADEKSLRRAGLDYWSEVEVHRHDTMADFEKTMQAQGASIFCLSAHAETFYTQIPYSKGVCLLFGAESRGLPVDVLERYRAKSYTIPMVSEKVRSLNLANAVAIVLYEGLRQLHGW